MVLLLCWRVVWLGLHRHIRAFIGLCVLVAATLVLGGCGQTGALYMPSEEAPRPPAAPVDGAEQKNKAS